MCEMPMILANSFLPGISFPASVHSLMALYAASVCGVSREALAGSSCFGSSGFDTVDFDSSGFDGFGASGFDASGFSGLDSGCSALDSLTEGCLSRYHCMMCVGRVYGQV